MSTENSCQFLKETIPCETNQKQEPANNQPIRLDQSHAVHKSDVS